jgi:LysM repeat protein
VARWRRLVRNLIIGAAAMGLLFLIFTIRALGAAPPAPPRVVVVQPGQTVWSIAEAQFPNQDPRQSVDEIDQVNHLHGGLVYPGERLRLPAA